MSKPEDTPAKGGTSANDEQVARLDALYQEIVQQRSTNRKMTLIGVLSILVILLIFCLRLYSIFNDYNKYVAQIKPDNLMKVLESPETDIQISAYEHPEIEAAFKDLIKEGHDRLIPSVKRSQKKLVEEILPDFSERVTEEMSDRHPEFVQAGKTLQANLTAHVEKMVKDDLMDVLGEEMAKSSDMLREQFPEMDDKVLADDLKQSEAYFYDELHELGLKKIARFDPVLRGLNQRIEGLAAGRKITPEMREEITDEFFEALFDRMKYEFVPSLGDQVPPAPEAPKAETPAPQPKKTPPESAPITKEGGAE